jgi:outer membrane receptor protein involved in Fe transport
MEDIPEHSVVALAGYYPPLADLGGPGVNGLLEADVEYKGSRYADEFNDREVDSFVTVNMRLGLQADQWDATIYVNNVFDDDTIKTWSSGTGLVATAERQDENLGAFPAEGFSAAPPPRHWGVRGSLRF